MGRLFQGFGCNRDRLPGPPFALLTPTRAITGRAFSPNTGGLKVRNVIAWGEAHRAQPRVKSKTGFFPP